MWIETKTTPRYSAIRHEGCLHCCCEQTPLLPEPHRTYLQQSQHLQKRSSTPRERAFLSVPVGKILHPRANAVVLDFRRRLSAGFSLSGPAKVGAQPRECVKHLRKSDKNCMVSLHPSCPTAKRTPAHPLRNNVGLRLSRTIRHDVAAKLNMAGTVEGARETSA